MKSLRMPVSVLILLNIAATSAWAKESPPATTRVWLSERCVVIDAGAQLNRQEIAPVFGAILSAIIPALVNKSVDVAAAALQAKANDKERKVAAAVGDNFYQTGADLKVDPAEVIGCLTIAHGRFPKTAANPAFTGFLAGQGETIQNRLIDKGVKATPDVYLEMTFEFSPDGRAFRLVPRLLLYPKALRGKDGGNFGGLAMIATFRGPAAKEGVESFALGSMAFTQARPGHEYQSGEMNENNTTNWMPLPAIDEDTRALLTAQAQNIEAAATAIRKRDVYLAESDADKVKIADRPELKQIGDIKFFPVSFQRPFANEAARKKYLDWKADLAKRVFEVERKKAEIQAALDAAAANQKSALGRKLRDTDTVLNALKEGLAAETAADLVSSTGSRIKSLVPFDVQVTIVESFEPSKFLAFAAGVLTDSKEGLSAGLSAQLDPAKREEAAKAKEKARLDAEIAARQLWADAMKAQLDYDSKTDALEKAKAALDLEIAKRKANRAYGDLGWAPPFPELGE